MFLHIISSADKKLSYMLISFAALLMIVLILQTGKMHDECYQCINALQRVEYFSDYGWSVDAESEEFENITFPGISDAWFAEYNKIQLSQGYDLRKWAGHTVSRYTYNLLDYPGYENRECMYATLYIDDGIIIASDIYNASVDGFIRGVKNGEM